jgi:hypothetical protein
MIKRGEILYIKNYISKHFHARDEHVYVNGTQDVIYAPSIIGEIVSVYGFNSDVIELYLKKWAKRRLKATWTPEMAQDLRAYQSIDVEAELIALLSEEISKEINFNIVRSEAEFNREMDRCGLEFGPMVYGPETFTPKKFIQTKR